MAGLRFSPPEDGWESDAGRSALEPYGTPNGRCRRESGRSERPRHSLPGGIA